MPTIKLLTILFAFLISACSGNTQELQKREKVTIEMVMEQEKLCPSPYKIEQIEEEIQSLMDTTSVDDFKKFITDAYDYTLNNRDSILLIFNARHLSLDEEFTAKKKHYKPEEEEIIEREDMYAKLVDNNHLRYRDTILKGTYFNQQFKDGASFLETQLKNNGHHSYNFKTEETINPFYYLNFHNEKDLRIMNIYYHDGTVNNTPTPIESSAFPLNRIPVDKMKQVDSLELEFRVRYLTNIDSIHFEKHEIGVQKDGFRLLKMEDNYIEYETPHEYYPYHKGAEYVSQVDSKEQLFLTLKYLGIKGYTTNTKKTRKTMALINGNIDAFTLYLENDRDTLTFTATLKNGNPSKQIFVHTMEGKTAFIDNSGKEFASIDDEIYFHFIPQSGSKSDRYFFTDTENDEDRRYYYLDHKNQTIAKLPYTEIDFLSPDIIRAWETEDGGFKLLSALNNELLSDLEFRSHTEYLYIDKGIYLYTEESTYRLFDQNNFPVTSNSEKVTSITLNKLEE